MELGLKDKVVVVTGASKGIGRAIALAFAKEGSHVVLNARNREDLDQVVQEIQKTGGSVLGIAGNVTKKADIEQLIQRTVNTFGTVHVLVNNAGSIGSGGAFEDLSDEEWQELFDLNLLSMVKAIRAVLPYMQRQHWGRIINMASESGIQPDPTVPHYNATKAAVINLSKSLSKAYASQGILVNSVSPAFIMTPLVVQMLDQQAKAQDISVEEAEKRFLQQKRPHMELGRAGKPEEVAPAVLFLASEQASFINGSNLRIDSGSVASI